MESTYLKWTAADPYIHGTVPIRAQVLLITLD
jgi:hypothetical protein